MVPVDSAAFSSAPDFAELLAAACRAARAAGEIHLAMRGEALDVRNKSHVADLVTAVDERAEAVIRSELGAVTPGVFMLGEETAHQTGFSGPVPSECWIVDPLDGTQNYVFGLPFYSVSIAYVCDGHVQLGVIHDALHGETFTVTRGAGARLNGQPLHVSGRATLDAPALLTTGFRRDVAESPQSLEPFLAVIRRGLPVRRLSSSALSLAYIAAGRLDAYWDEKLAPWDTAAGWLLIEEALGQVTDMRGQPYRLGSTLLASNGLLHGEMLELLSAAVTSDCPQQ